MTYCTIFKPDFSQLVSWSEEPEKVSTLPRCVKEKILQALGDAELVHAESFPQSGTLMPRIDENKTEHEYMQQVEGENDENAPEDANLEPEEGGESEEDLVPEPKTPKDDFEPTEQQKKDLQIAHENCGHPTAKDFARLLRRGNARPEIASWVAKHFKCPTCESNQRPKARRPTAVPKTYRFNHVVGIDLVSKVFDGVEYYWLNVVCWGTGYQMVYLVQGDGSKTPKNVWETFVDSWTRIFGMPEMVVMDPGTEFKAHFAQMCNGNGGVVLPTDARAPWQNGRTNRTGRQGVVKAV